MLTRRRLSTCTILRCDVSPPHGDHSVLSVALFKADPIASRWDGSAHKHSRWTRHWKWLHIDLDPGGVRPARLCARLSLPPARSHG